MFAPTRNVSHTRVVAIFRPDAILDEWSKCRDELINRYARRRASGQKTARLNRIAYERASRRGRRGRHRRRRRRRHDGDALFYVEVLFIIASTRPTPKASILLGRRRAKT